MKAGKNIKGSSGIIDGISVSEMSREQLESFVLRIQQELEREREERNFFQLERDKIKTFWEITRQQLEENRACLRYFFCKYFLKLMLINTIKKSKDMILNIL